jgi:hypothetical protein
VRAAPVLTGTVYAIVAFVVPEVPDVMVIQESLEAAVQEHDAVSAVVNEPPPTWTGCAVGFIAYAHKAVSCSTTSGTLPPGPWTVMRPERIAPVFAATVYSSDAPVVPEAGEILAIHT